MWSPSARPGRGSPNAGGGAEQRLGVRPVPPAPARPPPPGPVTWVLPGSRGGGGGGLGEDAGVTLRAAPRHKAAAPVLGRGHGPSRRGGKLEGAAWNQRIRGGQGHWRGGWRGRLFKKENQKGQRNGRSRRTTPGPLPGGGTIASRLQPGASRRARPRSVIYSCLFPFFSLYSRKKKKLN